MTKTRVKLSLEEVRHVAKLAGLRLTKDEEIKFQKQLSEIINFVDRLAEVNTKDVVSTSQVTGLENVFREDRITPSMTQEEVLANAPKKYKGYFVTEAIFE